MVELNGRQRALLERGYTYEEIIELSNFTIDELEFAINAGLSKITKGVKKVTSPQAIFVGGQPGCGKSSESMKIKDSLGDVVEVNIDNYRSYHPNYLAIEDCIKRHWEGRTPTDEDTPGNDLADFTHQFVSDISDAIIDAVSVVDDNGCGYNVVIEWGMRNPEVPLQTMESLKNKGYTNHVEFVCVSMLISLEACAIRANVSDDHDHIIRKVPTSFHELCVRTLPASIDEIYKRGFLTGIISSMKLCLRDGTVVWNDKDKEMPGEVFDKYLKNHELTSHFANSSALAKFTNRREVGGINAKLDELMAIRNEILGMSGYESKHTRGR